MTRVRKEAADISTIYFKVNGRMYDFVAGQYIAVYATVDEQSLAKAYSLSSAPHETEGAITVKRIGAMSGYVCDLRPGDTFSISTPFGFFNVQSDAPIVAIAAGVGIAPIWSIVKDELARDASRHISLFHSAPTHSHLVFAGEIDKLRPRHQNLTYTAFVTQEDIPQLLHRRFTVADDISPDMISNAQFYICGSEVFVRDIWQQLMRAGVDEVRVVTETFFEKNS